MFKNGLLGGLVGELLAGKDKYPQLFPDQSQKEQSDEHESVTEPSQSVVKPRFLVNAKTLRDKLLMGTLMQEGAYY